MFNEELLKRAESGDAEAGKRDKHYADQVSQVHKCNSKRL